jgi:hypothetical protein
MIMPPDRVNLNATKVDEFKDIKAKKARELCKKMDGHKVRSGVLNHQSISSVKWNQLKKCMLTGHIDKLIGNLHKDTDQKLGAVDNMDRSVSLLSQLRVYSNI